MYITIIMLSLHHNNSNKKNMNPEIFKHIECHTGNDLETIGFIGEFKNYFISFWGDKKNDYKLNVESFSVKIDDDWWEEIIPNDNYKDLMQIIIKDKYEDLIFLEFESKTKEKDFDGDYYKLYGLTEKMFY